MTHDLLRVNLGFGVGRLVGLLELLVEVLDLPSHVLEVLEILDVDVETLGKRSVRPILKTYKLLLCWGIHHAEAAEDQGQAYIVVGHLRHHVEFLVQLLDVDLAERVFGGRFLGLLLVIINCTSHVSICKSRTKWKFRSDLNWLIQDEFCEEKWGATYLVSGSAWRAGMRMKVLWTRTNWNWARTKPNCTMMAQRVMIT